MDVTRVDRWIWSVRLFRTRPLAAAACRAGHVRLNGERVKSAAPLRVGDTVRVRADGHERVVEVRRVIQSRVGAAVAADCLIDRSPPPPPRQVAAAPVLRDPGAGRPTKRERRRLDRARGRPG